MIVRIHQWDDLSENGPVAAIPALVDDVDINISATDMTLLTRQAELSSGNVAESFSVTKGSARQVEALAHDAAGQLIYNGYAYVDIFKTAQVVNLSMVSTTDSTPPTFAGIGSAQKVSIDTVTLSWSAATDNAAASWSSII